MNKNKSLEMDSKIKDMFNEQIEIPEIVNIKTVEAYDMLREVNRNKESKIRKIKPIKVAASIAVISTLTITTTFAVGYIIDYFNHNNESLYLADKNDFEKTSNNVNLTVKDKGIEFTIDSISIDDNYITVFHTSKSAEKIKRIDENYEDAYFSNPIIDAYIDGESIMRAGLIEHEATYVSDNELKGMQKIDVSSFNIDNNDEIEFRVNEIFGIEGSWVISAKIDKSKAIENTYNYNINKDYTIKQTYDYNNEKVDVKHNINVEKVTISPLANTILINENITKYFDDWSPMLGNSFALFDDENNSLDVLDKGGVAPSTGIASNSYEFLKASKDTKSLTLVPISFDYSIENKELEPQSIDNLPIVFKTSEYGKFVVEDIKITDKEIKYTYYKDGVVPGYLTLWFYDENGNEIHSISNAKESLDRHTGRYTTILNLEGHKNDISKIRSINKVSTYSNSDMKLLYDEQIKIPLTSN